VSYWYHGQSIVTYEQPSFVAEERAKHWIHCTLLRFLQCTVVQYEYRALFTSSNKHASSARHIPVRMSFVTPVRWCNVVFCPVRLLPRILLLRTNLRFLRTVLRTMPETPFGPRLTLYVNVSQQFIRLSIR
jgi:hypothetical protein